MGKIVGIDLGTTYSCVAYLNDLGDLEATKNDAYDSTTPSIVFFDPDEDTVIVGKDARAQSAFAPENIVERIKSQMESKDYTVSIKGVAYSPTAISSIILKKLKADAEEYLHDEIEGCVITCPAYFGTIGRNATKMAAEAAGLNVYSIINEPTAAAFAYAYQKKGEDINKNVLIYDLGGGTFDCTLLNMDFAGDAKHLNVIASNGDAFLGGKDWDAALRDYVIEEFCRNSGEDEDALKNNIECMVDLSGRVEDAKKLLSVLEKTKILVSYNGSKENIEVTRDKFDEITEHLLNKTIMLVNNMLQNDGKSPDDFEEIILVGGSTYMPQVEKRLEAEYGKPMAKFEPNEAVAKGAALFASLNTISNKSNKQSKNSDSDSSEVKNKKAKEIIDILVKMCDSYGFDYAKKDEFTVQGYLSVQEIGINIHYTIEAIPDVDVIRLESFIPFNISEKDRVEACSIICKINQRLPDGTFDYDANDGTIRFRLAYGYTDSRIGEGLLATMIMHAAAEVDMYINDFFMLSRGMISVEKLMKIIEGEEGD